MYEATEQRLSDRPGISSRSSTLVLTVLALLIFSNPVARLAVAAQVDSGGMPEVGTDTAGEDVVTYPAAFFDSYEPSSALAMVERIPGFQIAEGDDVRGFGGAGGNVLIDDRYVSSKQAGLSSTLDRIPASLVDRIELLRRRVRGIDLRGHSVVANVILHEEIPATRRWEASVRKNLNHKPLTFEGSLSVANRWRGVEYVVGVGGRRNNSRDSGPENLLDGDGVLIEERFDDLMRQGREWNGNLNALTSLGGTLVQLNVDYAIADSSTAVTSAHTPKRTTAAATEDLFLDGSNVRQAEIGADAERYLHPDLRAKAILLYFREETDATSSQRRLNDSGMQSLFRLAATTTVTTENIARLEFDWAASSTHAIQVNLEGAQNAIDNSLVQTVDTGAGPERVPIPGANARVEETRWDLMISDTWSVGRVELDFGIGGEASTITQEGDAEQKQSFSFLKPYIALTLSPTQERQTRVRLEREVSQLDFSNFVSATVFQDDDLALGNPNLRPQTTLAAELSEERRFGELSVFGVTIFHHWISDVEDLLPLTSTFEVAGNIGDGRRWGIEAEATVPLDSFGLAGAQLAVEARLQDSTVKDPVTGLNRMLSGEAGDERPIPFRGESRYAFGVTFRQDFPMARVAWGWDMRGRAERERFLVNELDAYSDGTELNAFVETTRWFGHKINLSVDNVLDMSARRNRTLFAGERGLTSIAYRELQDRTDGRRLLLTVNGSF